MNESAPSNDLSEQEIDEQLTAKVTNVFGEMEALINKKSELCVKCQKCCKSVGIQTAYPYQPAIVQFYEARGFNVIDKDGYIFLDLQMPCPKLTDSGCSIYENRPDICVEFDGRIHYDGECAWNELDNNGVE